MIDIYIYIDIYPGAYEAILVVARWKLKRDPGKDRTSCLFFFVLAKNFMPLHDSESAIKQIDELHLLKEDDFSQSQ